MGVRSLPAFEGKNFRNDLSIAFVCFYNSLIIKKREVLQFVASLFYLEKVRYGKFDAYTSLLCYYCLKFIK